MNIKVNVKKLTEDAILPKYGSEYAAGADLYSCSETFEIAAGATLWGIHKDDIDISTQENANRAIDVIGEAVNKLSLQRADIGAYQNRLEHKIDNLNVTRENLISSESKIRDTDMAVFMMEFTKNQILNNAAQAMLAQANSLPQSVLSLIQ